jgi:hypothetical protein
MKFCRYEAIPVESENSYFKRAKNVLFLDEGKFQKLIGYTRHYYFAVPLLA